MPHRIMPLLEVLEGRWRGNGSGNYPTIDAFEYEENLRFEVDRAYPLLHYEQKTVLLPSRESSHWESGFIRPQQDGSVEVSSSQDSGRVEVLHGRPVSNDGRLKLELDHVVLDHDPRLVGTRRVIEVEGDTLRYTVFMATNTTPQPKLQQHLQATLTRL